MALLRRLKTPFSEDVPNREPAAPFGPRSAGDLLRQQREALGLDLSHAAAALKIKPGYLAALEAGRPDLLPGPAYAIGFVRAYGDYLRLDNDEILRRFKAESTALDTKPDLAFPIPLGERSIPGGRMLMVALILALCGYGTWYYVSTAERTRPERVAELPPGLVALVGGEPRSEIPAEPSAAPPLTDAPPVAATPQAPALSGTEPAPSENRAGALPAASAALAMPAAPAAPPVGPPGAPQADAPHAFGAVDGSARIVIRATADSWVQIRSTDQALLFTRVLKPGETYLVPDRPGVSMRTGNAGGLEITVDGKSTAAIGPNGAVRTLPLEPQALLSRPAAGG